MSVQVPRRAVEALAKLLHSRDCIHWPMPWRDLESAVRKHFREGARAVLKLLAERRAL